MSILISADPAEELNILVQNELDPTLFISCNYTPLTTYVIHWDGRFWAAVTNLYRFAVDTSCIIPHLKKFIAPAQMPKFQSVFDQVDLIRLLRSILAHNNGENGNFFEQTQIERFNSWVLQTLHKSQPENDNDYELLYHALDQIGTSLVNGLKNFIMFVKLNPDCDQIIQKWQLEILRWYSTKRDIYLGQLASIYLAHTAATGIPTAKIQRIRSKIYPKLESWIYEALTYPLSSKISKMNFLIKEHPSLAGKIYKEKSTTEKELDDRVNEIRKCRSASNFFFANLTNYLLPLAESGDVNLLPQELIQQHIKEFFNKIPGEDFD